MPRIICRYDVCVFNKKSRCTAEEIEYDPDQGCLTAQTRDEFAGIVDEDEELEDDELEPDEDSEESEESDETLDDEFDDEDEFDDDEDADLDDAADDEDDLTSPAPRRRI